MTISLGSVEFDENVVKRQLRYDLRDDWFPDPRRFEDMLEKKNIEQVLVNNFSKNDGIFNPQPRTLFNIPKSNFTLRYGLETSLAERALYHALASKLVPFYDPLMPWNVFSHRASEDPEGRYLFRRAIPSWQDFTGVARDALTTANVLISTDLTNYFENIKLVWLKKTFLELLPEVSAEPTQKAAIRANIEALFECLKSWAYSDAAGLPQNRDASSFLANVYMLPVDRSMLAAGYRYFRYMDDIKIACNSIHDARRALKVLSIALRERGLAVNSGKTHIVPKQDEERVASCLDVGDPELQKIDSIWQTRSLRPISRSFPLLSDLTLRLLRGGEVGSRAFRYCIKRLEALAVCPEFQVPDAYFAPITPLVIDALADHPSTTDELVRYLRAVPTTASDLDRIASIIRDDDLNYYTWQNYRLWSLLTQKEYRTDSLLNFALQTIKDQPDCATRCGATLYAGAFGDTDARIEIAKGFSQLTSFMGQRIALLAVQELHFKPHIKDNIVPNLRDDLQNVYKNLDRSGIYVAPPLPMSITRILDTERDYD